nr:immunoglobulin heavy chain junction region [Macaca mulatta]MPN69791.1 immunoglobulin heavy chain junction region [Macaca mulatta]MPN69870.1 immunoglobulin heavy chain junction region [Macaca mulatta]MPN70183.1 immunoglobulin heavy chain junction region [Macaca mulatta]MPN70268.1 immunoglobulin heavy chain junction region [Macaca mulatta]
CVRDCTSTPCYDAGRGLYYNGLDSW